MEQELKAEVEAVKRQFPASLSYECIASVPILQPLVYAVGALSIKRVIGCKNLPKYDDSIEECS